MRKPTLDEFYSGQLSKEKLETQRRENRQELAGRAVVVAMLYIGFACATLGMSLAVLVEVEYSMLLLLVGVGIITLARLMSHVAQSVQNKNRDPEKTVLYDEAVLGLERYAQYDEAMRNYEILTSETSPEYWKRLKGKDLEWALSDMLKRQGWSVKLTTVTGDGGIDVEGQLGSRSANFQCKGHAKPLGVGAIRDAAGVKATTGLDMIVVSPNGFTKPSIDFAHQSGVELWDAMVLSEHAA